MSILTTSAAMEAAPGLIRNAIDSRITKVRPSATPIDQISRLAGSRKADSMEVAYYTVDPKPHVSQNLAGVSIGSASPSDDGSRIILMKVKDSSIFEKSDTVMFPTVQDKDGLNLTGYVAGIDGSELSIIVFNDNGGRIESTAPVVRMARAASELDVQSPQYLVVPKKSTAYCQIFKMQFEQSTLMRLADKEVGWSLSEQEEAAVMDMRLGMERSFMFGRQFRVFDKDKNEYVYLTKGIWSQAGDDHSMILTDMSSQSLITLVRKAFVGNNGSRKRLLIGGSGFISALSALKADEKIQIGTMYSKWGLEAREIITNFGRLYIMFSEVFDQCGHEKDAMVLDQTLITKYVHIPFHPEKLDLRAAGSRNTDAVVLTEASCLVLRNPKAHLRINGI